MTIMRMTFAGQIKKAEHKNVGAKGLIEVSICKKQKGKNGAEDTFCWLRINVWDPPEWLAPKLVKDAFIAGSGEFTQRGYEQDGQKKTSMEVRCTSFDIEVENGDRAYAAPEPAPVLVKPRVPVPPDEEPPF